MAFDNEAQYGYLLAATGAPELLIGGKRQAPINCPFCFAHSDERDPKSAFGNIMTNGAYGGWGFHCFGCDNSVNLYELGYLLDIGVVPSDDVAIYTNNRTKPTQRQMTYTWMDRADELANQYASNPGRYAAWDNYKHLGADAVDAWQLGLGVLPETSKFNQERLITPIHDQTGHVIWIRGRLKQGELGTKWVGAGGVSPTSISLAMGGLIKEGRPLVICENYVDALAINHYLPMYSAVPTFSVSYWSKAWVETIAAAGPSQVLVAFDPDLAGNGPVSVAHAKSLFTSRIAKLKELPEDKISLVKWQKKNTGWRVFYEAPDGQGVLNIPVPFGIQRAAQLLEAGIPATVAKWTDSRYDIGDFLAQELLKLKESKS